MTPGTVDLFGLQLRLMAPSLGGGAGEGRRKDLLGRPSVQGKWGGGGGMSGEMQGIFRNRGKFV